MFAIDSNLQAVRQRIAHAAQTCQRPSEAISLIAVSKTFSAQAVLAAIAAGQYVFGENYLQEAVAKIAAVQDVLCAQQSPAPAITWHFIGPIQSNKTRLIAEHFDWVHSVDRLRIAERLAQQRPAELAPLKICIQVNLSGEASKSGVLAHQVEPLARALQSLPRLELKGLMAIPQAEHDYSNQYQAFRQLQQLGQQLQQHGIPCPELSMGMSGDLEAAIAAGATMVRVGTAIFGARSIARQDIAGAE